MVNTDKLREVLTKGILLLGITGALTLGNGAATIGNTQAVYAATAVQSKKESALKSLEKTYKTYYKKYYTEKEYNKLTKIYNKGINALNNCDTKTEISDTLKTYKEKLLGIKPSVFVKYQKKMEKNLLTYYKDLLKNNTYSADGLAKLEEAKNTAVENIYSKKTKAKAKKAKANGIKELDSIFTLGAEVTPDATKGIKETALEISASEYLEYPVPGVGIMVYFKLAPEISYYPDVDTGWGNDFTYTYGEYYDNSIKNGSAEVVCMVDEGSELHVSFTCNPYYSIDYYIKHADVGIFGDGMFTHTISEPEICENGLNIYTVQTDFGLDSSTEYIMEYQIDENNVFQVIINGFDEAFKDPIYQTELEAILSYYRTVENLILVVDKNTPVTIVP